MKRLSRIVVLSLPLCCLIAFSMPTLLHAAAGQTVLTIRNYSADRLIVNFGTLTVDSKGRFGGVNRAKLTVVERLTYIRLPGDTVAGRIEIYVADETVASVPLIPDNGWLKKQKVAEFDVKKGTMNLFNYESKKDTKLWSAPYVHDRVGAGDEPNNGKSSEVRILKRTLVIAKLPYVGGGDADVHSKNGRTTRVTITTSCKPRFDKTLGHLSTSEDELTVTCEVQEIHKNYTRLKGTATVVFSLDEFDETRVGTKKYELSNLRKPMAFVWFFGGERHNVINCFTSVDAANRDKLNRSVFTKLSIRLDGKGDDNNGNAFLKAELAIPFTVQPK